MRNGKRLGKSKAIKKFQVLNHEDRQLVFMAVRHYATSEFIQKGFGIKDAHRWLRDGRDDEPWREWIEPAQRTADDREIQKRIVPQRKCARQVNGDMCKDDAVPGSRFCQKDKEFYAAIPSKHGIVTKDSQ